MKLDPTTIEELRTTARRLAKHPDVQNEAALTVSVGYFLGDLGIPEVVLLPILEAEWPAAAKAARLWAMSRQWITGEFRRQFYPRAATKDRVGLIKALDDWGEIFIRSELAELCFKERTREYVAATKRQLVEEFDSLATPGQVPAGVRAEALLRFHLAFTWDPGSDPEHTTKDDAA